MQYVTRSECLGTGHSAENERRYPVLIHGASDTVPRTATTRPCRGSTKQKETQTVETVSQATLETPKTGKPRQRIWWSDEMNMFLRAYIT